MKEELEKLIQQLVDRGIRLDEGLAEFEKRFIQHAFVAHNGNRFRAARALGIHRNTMSRKIELYKLDERPRRRRAKEKIPPQRVGAGRRKKARESA